MPGHLMSNDTEDKFWSKDVIEVTLNSLSRSTLRNKLYIEAPMQVKLLHFIIPRAEGRSITSPFVKRSNQWADSSEGQFSFLFFFF